MDLDNGQIHIFDLKGVNTRQAYMTAQIRQALRASALTSREMMTRFCRLAPAGSNSTFQVHFTVW